MRSADDSNEDEQFSQAAGTSKKQFLQKRENNGLAVVHSGYEDANPAYPLLTWYAGDKKMSSLHWRGMNAFRKEDQ